MSIYDRELQAIIDRGGRRSESKDPIPVLFGTRVIQNPRVVWVKTKDLGSHFSPDYPTDNKRFALLSALTYGEIESVPTIYVNGQRLNAASRDFLHKAALHRNGEFKDSEFFGETGELSGRCRVSSGSSTEAFSFLGVTTSKKRPANVGIKYKNIAMAHVYADVNASASFNNWSFLTSRFDTGWQPSLEKIEIDKHTRFVQTGGDTLARPIVLAVDCSPINGIGVELDGASIKYRYDLIREQVLEVIKGYADVLASSQTSYLWSLEVLLLKPYFTSARRDSGNRIIYAAEEPTYNKVVEFSFSHDGKTYSGDSKYLMRSDDKAGNIAYLNALATAVENHEYLQIARVGNKHTAPYHIGGDPRFSGYVTWDDKSYLAATPLTQKDFLKAFKPYFDVPINKSYTGTKNVGASLITSNRFDQATPTGAADIRRGVILTPCDWGEAFDHVRVNRSSDMFGSSDSLPQISFITGPTWPYVYGSADYNLCRVVNGFLYNYKNSNSSTGITFLDDLKKFFGDNERPDRQLDVDKYIGHPMWLAMLSDLYTAANLRTTVAGTNPVQEQQITGFRDWRSTGLFSTKNAWHYWWPHLNYFPRKSVRQSFSNMKVALGLKYDPNSFRTDMVIFDPCFYSPLVCPNVPLTYHKAFPLTDALGTHWFYWYQVEQSFYEGQDAARSSRTSINYEAENNPGGAAPLFDEPSSFFGFAAEDNYPDNNFGGHKDDARLPPRDSTNINLMQAAARGVTSGVTHQNASKMILDGMKPFRSPIVHNAVEFKTNAINPVHILHQCLTTRKWATTKYPMEIDEPSFIAAAEQMKKEELGVCFLWDQQSTLSVFVNEVLRHMDGVLFIEDMKVKIKLIGREVEHYAINPLIADPNNPEATLNYTRNPTAMTDDEFTRANTEWIFNEQNVHSVTNFKVPREEELINTVIIEYTDYDALAPNAESIQNEGLVAKYGVNSKSFSYLGCPNAFIAGTKIGERNLALMSTPLISFDLEVYREHAIGLHVGDVIKFEWAAYNIETLYARVMSKQDGDGRKNSVKLKLLQVNIGTLEDRP